MTEFLSKWIKYGVENANWMILEMDVTQWGIVTVIFVITGFLALKTRF